MQFPLGFSGEITSLGVAPYSQCKRCKSTPLYLSETFLSLRIMSLPSAKVRRVMLATCPRCATIMEVAPDTAKKLRQDSSTLLLPQHLREPQHPLDKQSPRKRR